MAKKADDMYVPATSPIADPEAIAKLFRRDAFLVKWLNYSPVARMSAKANNLPPVSTFILVTKGRKSGRRIETPIFYFRHGGSYVVIGSNGGDPRPPKWFLNLTADPDCEVHVWWRTRKVRARVATGDERSRIWEKATKAFPNYLDYAKTATPREIPVVILERR